METMGGVAHLDVERDDSVKMSNQILKVGAGDGGEVESQPELVRWSVGWNLEAR